MQVMDAAQALCQAIAESPEYREYARLKEEIAADAGIQGLVTEYKRLQAAVQLRALSGQGMEGEEAQRFGQLSALLFADQRTAPFLLAEMRLQKMMAEIFEKLTRAAGMELTLPV